MAAFVQRVPWHPFLGKDNFVLSFKKSSHSLFRIKARKITTLHPLWKIMVLVHDFSLDFSPSTLLSSPTPSRLLPGTHVLRSYGYGGTHFDTLGVEATRRYYSMIQIYMLLIRITFHSLQWPANGFHRRWERDHNDEWSSLGRKSMHQREHHSWFEWIHLWCLSYFG